jgi:hypothetical protein
MPLLSLPIDVLRLIGDEFNQRRTAQSQLDILRLRATCKVFQEIVQLEHVFLSFKFPSAQDFKVQGYRSLNPMHKKIKSFVAFTESHRNYKELHLTASGSPSICDRPLQDLFWRMNFFRPLDLETLRISVPGPLPCTFGEVRLFQLRRVDVYMPHVHDVSKLQYWLGELRYVDALNLYSRYTPDSYYPPDLPLLVHMYHHHLGANLDRWATRLHSYDLLSILRSISVTSLYPVEEAFREDYKQKLAIFSQALARPLPLLQSFRLDEQGDWPDEPLDAFVAPNVQKIALPWWAIEALVLKVTALKFEGLEESRFQEVVLSLPPPGHAWLGEGKVDGLGAVFRDMGATLYLCHGDCKFLQLLTRFT